MASVVLADSSQHGKVIDGPLEIEEEEEELFEIDLEAVNNLPPPHYWESYFTATRSTLFANCLLPIADVSSAVPIASSNTASSCKALSLAEQLMLFNLQNPPFQHFEELLIRYSFNE
ncbi:hypothetical protein K2173_012135 [Erythroxylum novogranatense]|uniref:Uncharacterized protein n=1 Tax=Erythroxylum novogranatense TaxID=1862640 RepID=A0AAV8SR44_9ROSI|nr:hypothetical protein K2173_012135 [Erythroxylum novogranatense]